ncbi:MAG TPA: adenylate kinase [Candidatus Marinimicrobia bacterium]|jgi:adenylate kinase|nr:adenylate kinase [Candidatus Neomarinimicrobiota bacterium]MDP6296926.1 adenylate kinase [Candidatus Neomarinimicrobiota bacterium]MDP7120889.1 adenylate kinase [Candidatus Neomarinimicrobiota bacterium]MDP7484227.1 adenylate kinase [Candidatus Neomarinimicrobiota bacterium]MDP7528860.1 adenylate kinase [Candidatus Neomarinimicrobiota bacterium]|tara:strand:+ start:1088 stop:1747 length:660 start_codon:yes stop_codon:yes gene_type:complete
MRLIFLGPPGIGKGTQAKLLAERHSLAHLSTGDMFRSVISRNTDLGTFAKSFMDKGKLVPDDVVLGMVNDRLREDDTAGGYIFDGFPRTVPQAEGLKKLLKELGQSIDHVLALEGDDTVLVERLSSRRTCLDCGKIINLIFSPSKVSGQCDDCGGELFQRNDDKPKVIQKRLDVYEEQTEPLVNYYESKALLRRVDGVGSVHEVAERIDKYLINNILEE